MQVRSPPDERVLLTRTLLQRLESGCRAASAPMPAEVISAMTAMHEIVNAMDPTPPDLRPLDARLDGPLEDLRQQATEPRGGSGAVADVNLPLVPGDDDVIMTLDGVDESEDAALLKIARQLKRARRA